MSSVEVELRSVLVEVVGARQSLLGGRSLQELHVVLGVVLAIDQFVDFLLASQKVTVTLEHALPEVVEYMHAQRLDFQTE